ncbi:BamA/TamA family outer membrane protein [Paracoccus sp. KR1-242]|uniref:BamA/TamA family outer membrane protein n=1 Tax=Paracoccus sp. KR1-242 TaxID=3410028 RepID=UPI003C0F8D87
MSTLPRSSAFLGFASAFVISLSADAADAFDFSIFVDPDDHMFDASALLARGGFIPIPVIITEPAVQGGFGVVGQFINSALGPGGQGARTMVGLALTGNDSKAGGIMRTGQFREGKARYQLAFGGADITLPIFPFGLDRSVDYNNSVFGGIAAARFKLGETNFWLGPRLTYRHTEISLGGSEEETELGGRVRSAINDVIDPQQYISLGASLHYDTRNNPVSPTSGINAVLKFDRYDDAIGSDADFNNLSAVVTSFTEFGDAWSFGILAEYDAVSSGAPFFMAPSVALRGVQHGRYSGDSALTSEIELRRQFTPRWAGVVFGGYGETHVEDSRLFHAEDGIWTYGAGFRYRIARKMGIDAGLDVAKGPEDTIFYIQFGHAWMRQMD